MFSNGRKHLLLYVPGSIFFYIGRPFFLSELARGETVTTINLSLKNNNEKRKAIGHFVIIAIFLGISCRGLKFLLAPDKKQSRKTGFDNWIN